jgi:hypothetical protein
MSPLAWSSSSSWLLSRLARGDRSRGSRPVRAPGYLLRPEATWFLVLRSTASELIQVLHGSDHAFEVFGHVSRLLVHLPGVFWTPHGVQQPFQTIRIRLGK